MIVRLATWTGHQGRRNRLLRAFSSATAVAGEKMRVAIVGGGAAGMSAALHLAPLVAKGLLAGPIDLYESGPGEENDGSKKPSYGTGAIGRDIGVGVWTTALTPLLSEIRDSHKVALEGLKHAGRFVGQVGYRTPNGAWLAKSKLPTSMSKEQKMQGLLFLREKDMLESLRKAVQMEEEAGTIQIHWDKAGPQTQVAGIHSEELLPWSAKLAFDGTDKPSARDYHLIVAAEGLNSNLRKLYAGHRNLKPYMMGTAALHKPAPDYKKPVARKESESSWEDSGHKEANAIEDRKYTVYRGNANMTIEEAGMDGVSFQTWGTGRSMRFATVPLSYPDGEGRTEKQVWFITSSDERIANEPDAYYRKQMLMSSFSSWHDPIIRMLEATPDEEIISERALAHRHSMGPILNVNRVLLHTQQLSREAPGPGPAMIFVGDAYMTVDPILAQGFTMAMEAGYELANSLERCCNESNEEPSLAFDPYMLRSLLRERHDRRGTRLIKLLRATELVQALGQPDSKTAGGLISQSIVRPLMRITPGFVKRPIFDSMLRYSLDA